MAAGSDRPARAARAARPQGARSSFGPGRRAAGGIYPTRGKGHGIAGEAAFPDLLTKWDKDQTYTVWRQGMDLALDPAVMAGRRFTALNALTADPFNSGATTEQTVILAGFLSSGSPDGQWLVGLSQRGDLIAPWPLAAATQLEQRVVVGGQLLLRLLRVELGPAVGARLKDAKGLIGELWEDSAISPTELHSDDADGTMLMCLGIHSVSGTLFFDATRRWRRRRIDDGKTPQPRLQLESVAIADDEPLVTFRSDRYLTISARLACNCPAGCGAVMGRFSRGAEEGLSRLDRQEVKSVFGGQAGGVDDTRNAGDNERGIARRFRNLTYQRDPAAECKHMHAMRWLMGCPQREPDVGPTLENDYWTTAAGQNDVEAWLPPMLQPDFLERWRSNLLREAQLQDLDGLMLPTVVAGVCSIMPHTIKLAPQQLAPIFPSPLRATMGPQDLRMHALHHSADPLGDWDAVFGDWWVGRNDYQPPRLFLGPSQVGPVALRAIQLPSSWSRAADQLPFLFGGFRP